MDTLNLFLGDILLLAAGMAAGVVVGAWVAARWGRVATLIFKQEIQGHKLLTDEWRKEALQQRWLNGRLRREDER
jgi:hypothetical protein